MIIKRMAGKKLKYDVEKAIVDAQQAAQGDSEKLDVKLRNDDVTHDYGSHCQSSLLRQRRCQASK